MTAEKDTVNEQDPKDQTQPEASQASRPWAGPTLRQRFAVWRHDKSRGPRVVRAVVAIVAVLLLIVAPAYIATQPSFVQRYPNLTPNYETWSTSVHANVPCMDCHVKPDLLSRSLFTARMLSEFYISMVAPGREPKLFGPPVNSSCESCHEDLRTVSPSGDLNIPHRAHVDVLHLPCIRCHTYLVHQANPEGTHTPRMVTCLQCHNGKIAKNGCSTCHRDKAIPQSHRDPNWLIIHPTMQAKINCKQCHAWTANFCVACHITRPKDHGPDWRTKHGQQVAIHRNCEACHPAAFCINCHGQLPMKNFNPNLHLVTGPAQ
jgi:hypothetical protein